MHQRTCAIFPIFVGTDSLPLVFCDIRVVLTVWDWPIVYTLLYCFPSTSISISLGWLGVMTLMYHRLLWGLFLWGHWICRWIWGSQCGMRQAIHDQVNFAEELVVAQRYLIASIHSNLVLLVIYDPPCFFHRQEYLSSWFLIWTESPTWSS